MIYAIVRVRNAWRFDMCNVKLFRNLFSFLDFAIQPVGKVHEEVN